jgi:hypothetical protein
MARTKRYWLVHPNGGRQLIDPKRFNLKRLAESARALGGEIQVETVASRVAAPRAAKPGPRAQTGPEFDLPVPALGPLFKARFEQIHVCREAYEVDMNTRPTTRVLGGYYRKRRLIRVYTHDRAQGRRALEELFDTFLHEMAHHIEYTEPETYNGHQCGRVPGRMHSRLFWHILGTLKMRWARAQETGAF